MLSYLLALALTPPGLAADVRLLGHDRFRVREAASARLLARGESARLALARVARDHPDPEVRKRAGTVHATLLGRRLKSYGKLPYLDMLWYDAARRGFDDEHPLRRGLSPYLYDRDGHVYAAPEANAGERWPTFRVATSRLVEDLASRGVPDALIKPALAEMARREKVYLATCEGRQGAPPVANALPPAP